jgi:hypothetical protein
MSDNRTYYYDEQFKKYLTQFLAVFGGMQVMVGKNKTNKERLIEVPIFSASKDRVVAAIKAENTQNKALRLPAMSGWISNIELAPEARKGVGGVRRNTVASSSRPFPEGVHVVEQRMPVPYKINFELNIWSSNQDQNFQILEQILMIFDPILQIQTSDDPMDWKQISTLELIGIRVEENIAPGTDRRMIKTVLDFGSIVHISVSDKVHRRFIEKIRMRIGMVNSATKTEDVVAELDALGEKYFTVADANNIDLDKD